MNVIRQVDDRRSGAEAELAELRERLSPRGDVVSEAGRRRTIEVFGAPLSPSEVVTRIAGAVRARGIEAVLEYGRLLDGADLTAMTIRVPAADLEAAHRDADSQLLETVRTVRERVLAFQRAILHRDAELPLAGGGFLRQRYVPLDRVGICVPGGAAAYPSTLLMTIVPAQAAGVSEIAVVAPPTRFGAYNRDLLAVCHELGVSEVYRVGGAQGVSALAYGAGDIPRVDKIVGPGNLFVALAKKQVFGEVDIDSIAGPSEVLVLADDTARVEFVAADLIAQAEHSPGASIVVTWSAALWNALPGELERQMASLSRSELARQSLAEFGASILVADVARGCAIANWLAPEHLHVACERPERLLPQLRHAGAIFLGDFSPVAVGDYAAGPSHVLPTGGTARWARGLSANDFLRSMSVIALDRDELAAVAPEVRLLAETEGLTAHWASVARRLEQQKPG